MAETYSLSNLQQLEAESIQIIREVTACFENPVMLYSVGKDSSVMVHLARKAFAPGKIPFPLLHVDTTMKFPEMYEFRDRFTREIGADLRVYVSPGAASAETNPYDLGTQKCCAVLKTQALLDALREGGYDAAFGGARREEEKSRAKERVLSFRDRFGQWDPKEQRPELWELYNTRINKGESIRAFPLSNWTELDVWQYVAQEGIPVVPLYFAAERPVVEREGLLIPVYERTRLEGGEQPREVVCRFRTLGCYPCTGAVRSEARTVEEIVEEMMVARQSERITRVIDHDAEGSMEQKKREGYF
jgi:sulfate adenylyltransferase subunit 2